MSLARAACLSLACSDPELAGAERPAGVLASRRSRAILLTNLVERCDIGRTPSSVAQFKAPSLKLKILNNPVPDHFTLSSGALDTRYFILRLRTKHDPAPDLATAPADCSAGFPRLMTAARLDCSGAIPHCRFGVPRRAREIAVLLPFARQDYSPKRHHDVNHEPSALSPHADPPRPYDFSALAPPIHHAPARPDAISCPARDVSSASDSRPRRRRRSAAATRTTIPSAACQYVPSGPARTNSKSRNTYGLAKSSFARFIFCASLSKCLSGTGKTKPGAVVFRSPGLR
jgi:hypothetical protein